MRRGAPGSGQRFQPRLPPLHVRRGVVNDPSWYIRDRLPGHPCSNAVAATPRWRSDHARRRPSRSARARRSWPPAASDRARDSAGLHGPTRRRASPPAPPTGPGPRADGGGGPRVGSRRPGPTRPPARTGSWSPPRPRARPRWRRSPCRRGRPCGRRPGNRSCRSAARTAARGRRARCAKEARDSREGFPHLWREAGTDRGCRPRAGADAAGRARGARTPDGGALLALDAGRCDTAAGASPPVLAPTLAPSPAGPR
jgi:hypothetical protein